MRRVVLLLSGKMLPAGLLGLLLLFSIAMPAQEDGSKAIPILTGSVGHFTRVNGGQYQDASSVSPLLLLPLGERWLVEAKGNLSDTFTRNARGDYDGAISYGLGYAQVDYITRYATFSTGRFITPFGIYGERLAPNWIRALQITPMSSSVISGSALGGMLRGGFPVGTENINLNYAVYFSANNTHHLVATDRSTGGRVGFFLPGPRLEIGASFQQVLQADRPHSTDAYFVWQPNRAPLSLRSEYVRSSGTKGSGYWIESVYRLSQIPCLRRLELAGRGQQFFAAENLSSKTIKKLGALGKDTNQADFGLNYYLRSDVRASASYGRQFVQDKNANLWTVGMTYRFVLPLGPRGENL